MTQLNFDLLAEIHGDMAELIDKVNLHYSKGNFAQETPLQTSMRLAYRMGLEYYLTAIALTKIDKVSLTLSAASLVRALMEVGADIHHIVVDPEKVDDRAQSYKDSVDTYVDSMKRMATKMLANEEYSLKYPNPWTSSTIQDRIAARGPGTVQIYDYFSAFTHANPAYYVYLVEKQLGETLRFNIRKAALVHMMDIVRVLAVMGLDLDIRKIELVNKKLYSTDSQD